MGEWGARSVRGVTSRGSILLCSLDVGSSVVGVASLTFAPRPSCSSYPE